MTTVEPQPPRFAVDVTPEGLRATLPAGHSVFAMLFLCVWLVGWTFGEFQALQQLQSPSEKTPSLFLFVWLAGWTVGGVFAVATLAWQLAGAEIITVGGNVLTYRIETWGIGLTRSYWLADVKRLRAVGVAKQPFGSQAAWFPPFAGATVGAVAFDYGARTIRFGAALEEAEALLLVNQLGRQTPQVHDAMAS